MEYAKDISIKLNDGQARKKGNSSKILKRLRKHKIIATITILYSIKALIFSAKTFFLSE